ncbi:hypothetical protein [Nostoc sp.]|uniref:hypothetical protein n=1 Tax=Nostoc sp. TaxID=1180 RepID=UPI002FF97999
MPCLQLFKGSHDRFLPGIGTKDSIYYPSQQEQLFALTNDRVNRQKILYEGRYSVPPIVNPEKWSNPAITVRYDHSCIRILIDLGDDLVKSCEDILPSCRGFG